MSQEVIQLPAGVEPPTQSMDINTQVPDASQSSSANLKRRASASFEDAADSSSRKKLKEDMGAAAEELPASGELVNGQNLADELEQELQCGCCSALVYRPVLVSPCQHFFCGSCIILWIMNGGTNCPACRGVSTAVTPSRALQVMTDILVRHAPSKARTVNERMQADEVYKAGTSLRIPLPRLPSPEPSIPQLNANYVQPCPHCSPDNQWGWRCPQPIPDPEIDPDNAWHNDDGNPPGHAYCGNCENILALNAPTTSKCDFCQVSFCGISVPQRCVAAPLANQHLHMLSDIGDMIQCGDIYDVFDGNTVEVDILLDYMTANGITPRHIYREVVGMILSTPQQFQPLVDAEVFVDVHRVASGIDPAPSAPRNKICRICATEILLWGLRAWWMLERKKGLLDESVTRRPDCPDGRTCARQKDQPHAKEFNHIILPRELQHPVEVNSSQAHLRLPPMQIQGSGMPRGIPLGNANAEAGSSRIPVNVNIHALEAEHMEDDFMHSDPILSDPMDSDADQPEGREPPFYGQDIPPDHAEVSSGMKDMSLSALDKYEYHAPEYHGGAPVPSSQEIVDSML